MKRIACALFAFSWIACSSSSPKPPAETAIRVRMITTGGILTLKLLPDIAPRTVAQFKRLVEARVYDTVYFYRVEKGFVAQTATADDREFPLSPQQRAVIQPIPREAGRMPHKRGVLSLAHGDDPNSGTTSFSILLGDAPHLDGKYTVFGVVEDSEATLEQFEELFDHGARDAAGRRLQIITMRVIVSATAAHGR